MKTFALKGEIRDGFGESSSLSRRELIPCVVKGGYGRKT